METYEGSNEANRISLSTLLSKLTKDELQLIRRDLEVPQASQLNKGDLVHVLSTYMIEHLEQHLERLDQDRYRLLERVMQAPNYAIVDTDLTIDEFEGLGFFRKYGLLFSQSRTILMPNEVAQKLRQVNVKRLRIILARNTEWVKLTEGLLYFYGILSFKLLIEKIQSLTGRPVNKDEYRQILMDLEGYNYSVLYSVYGFFYYSVDDPELVYQEHESRPSLAYYSVTKNQALRASEEAYIDRHAEYRVLAKFVRNNSKWGEEDADATIADLVYHIQRGRSPSELVSYMAEELELLDMDQLQQLMDLMMNFYNHTRQWALKGHSPNEVSKQTQKDLNPLPQHPFDLRSSDAPVNQGSKATVYDLQTKTKIGRNDPCPCGSGEKFKKCCGA